MITVERQSDIELHDEVYKIAEYFKEELNYNKIPYGSQGMPNGENKALLFTEETQDLFPAQLRIFGACCFSKLKFTKASDFWALEWIWLHPFFRHRGKLKKYWPYLEKEFGNFVVKEPISSDMKAFMNHVDSVYEHKTL